MQGRIIRGVGGFYYLDNGKEVYECRARGVFRKNGEKPLVGDLAEFSVTDEAEKSGNVDRILERKNRIVRPALANVDRIFLLFSASVPAPNYDMLNRYLALQTLHEIPLSLVVTKSELASKEERQEIADAFRAAPYPLFFISVFRGSGLDALREAMRGGVSALAGPSGAGKSTLLNALKEEEVMEVGSLSRKIARGKNTTRHSELFRIGEDSWLFDTPGFTAIDLVPLLDTPPEQMFPEFEPYLEKCRFHGCRHLKEPGCAIRAAVKEGELSRIRYLSYRRIQEELSLMRRY